MYSEVARHRKVFPFFFEKQHYELRVFQHYELRVFPVVAESKTCIDPEVGKRSFEI